MDELGDGSVASVKSKTSSGLICGKLHDVIISEFIDKYFIIISSSGKIGTLVQISFETNSLKNSTSLCTKVLFGKDGWAGVTIDIATWNAKPSGWLVTSAARGEQSVYHIDKPEVHGVAQSIVEVLNIKKPVVFGFSAKEYDSSTAMEMRQLIAKALLENDKENLSNQNSVS